MSKLRRKAKVKKDEEDDDDFMTPSEVIPPCPLCQKDNFRTCASRKSHLKSCGTKNGVESEKLIALRRLEEKQAQERKDILGSQLVSTSKNKENKGPQTRFVNLIPRPR